jgi:hypothetical protein
MPVAETSFDYALERMYADPPPLADAELFALRVMDRLERGWTVRRLLIGVMGVVGGFIGAAQVLNSRALGQLSTAVARSDAFVGREIAPQLSHALAPAGVSVDSQAIWMAAALAVVAVGFGLARLVREI